MIAPEVSVFGRHRGSWGEEVAAGLVNAFPNSLDNLHELRELSVRVCDRPHGGYIVTRNDPESLFMWGRINHLIPYVMALSRDSDQVWTRMIETNFIKSIKGPRIVIHTDKRTTISAENWRKASEYGLKDIATINSACSTMGKADIIILTPRSANIAGLSVKAGTGTSEVKLSQQSTSLVYKFKPRPYDLVGGMRMSSLQNMDSILDTIPVSEISQLNTDLRMDQFARLSPRDKRFAVLKKTKGREWSEIVQQALEESYARLKSFGISVTECQEYARFNLRELMLTRLIGDAPLQRNCEMWLSGIVEPVNLSELLLDESRLKAVERIHTDIRASAGGKKTSLVVYVTAKNDTRYVACKVEPSFDGGRSNVSQTKGIIYYFQEGRQLGLPTIWNLIQTLWTDR